jgi:hypothetical protein
MYLTKESLQNSTTTSRGVMKKQIMIFGTMLLLITVLLSGCDYVDFREEVKREIGIYDTWQCYNREEADRFYYKITLLESGVAELDYDQTRNSSISDCSVTFTYVKFAHIDPEEYPEAISTGSITFNLTEVGLPNKTFYITLTDPDTLRLDDYLGSLAYFRTS